MTQAQLERAVCRATGESRAFIHRMGFSLVEPTPDHSVHYNIYTWDHEAQAWQFNFIASSLFGIRRYLRILYAEGWDRPSILVCSSDYEQPEKRN